MCVCMHIENPWGFHKAHLYRCLAKLLKVPSAPPVSVGRLKCAHECTKHPGALWSALCIGSLQGHLNPLETSQSPFYIGDFAKHLRMCRKKNPKCKKTEVHMFMCVQSPWELCKPSKLLYTGSSAKPPGLRTHLRAHIFVCAETVT